MCLTNTREFISNKIVVTHTGHYSHKVFGAIVYNDLKLVRRIIRETQTPNILNLTHTSALHHAVMLERIEIVEYLIRKGAIVNTTTIGQSRSPLYSAYMVDNNKLISVLEKAGAVKIKDAQNWFPRF